MPNFGTIKDNYMEYYMENIINDLTNSLSMKVDGIETKAVHVFNEKLFGFLKENLKKLGYPVIHDDMVKGVFAKRMTRCCMSTEPYIYDFYLDFIDEGNRGLYIGGYEYLNNINCEGNNVNSTMEIKFREI